jgi:ADP-heptose:LPS heptosyltransferase
MSDHWKNVLITRTDRIGDVILSLPVAGAIKHAFPETRVTFMVGKASEPVVRMCPWIDETLVVGSGSEATLAQLQSGRFDAAVCLYPRSELARLLQKAKIPVRVGTARRVYSYRFNRRINLSRRAGGRHERDFNLALLRGLGIETPIVLDPVCIPSYEATASARILLGELGIGPRTAFVVVHPGCGGSARNWTPQNYRSLCRALHTSGIRVVVSGSEHEADLVKEVVGDMGKQIQSIAGRTDLLLLSAILKEASVFIGPSTGPMHLAASVGTPVVALFGPVRTTGPDRWGPLGDGHSVFVPPVETCRCRINECRLGDCMAMIEPAAVADAVLDAAGQARKGIN